MLTSEFLGFVARCVDCDLSIDHRLATDRLQAAQYIVLTLPTAQDWQEGIPADKQQVVLRFLLAAAIARSEGK